MFRAPFVTFTIYIVKVISTRSIADHAGICKGFFRNIFPFLCRCPVVCPDCRPNFQQKVFGDTVGGIPQVVQDCGG